jgi:HTH-type transcriptional regulator/antitoxin HigA
VWLSLAAAAPDASLTSTDSAAGKEKCNIVKKEEMIMRTLSRNVRDDYLALVKRFPLTSIRTEAQLLAAQKVMDDILKMARLTKGAIEYLDALSDLVLTYENTHHVIPAPSDADFLRHLMDVRGIKQAALHEATGIAMSTISEILSGRRRFSKSVIARLSAYFKIEKGTFAANF